MGFRNFAILNYQWSGPIQRKLRLGGNFINEKAFGFQLEILT